MPSAHDPAVIALDLSGTFGEGMRGAVLTGDARVAAGRQGITPLQTGELVEAVISMATRLKERAAAGWLLSVVARAQDEAPLAELLLRHTSTLGVRVHDVRRHEAGRRTAEVDTPFGRVAVKLKLLAGEVVSASPEFESVRERAAAAHAQLSAVHAAAAAAVQALVAPGAEAEADR